MHNEALYYNAVAMALHGDVSKMRRFSGWPSWHHAYEHLAASGIEASRLPNLPGPPNPEDAWKLLDAKNIRLIFHDDADYPPLLREIRPSPLALYVRGENIPRGRDGTRGGGSPTIAIVGTRRATPEGNRTAREFGRELARAGCAIVSGLALGIDASAHEGALDAGGRCIAVLANGLDRIYPESNHRLAEKILTSGGMIVSEYPPGEHPVKYRFLERNRVISGLANGTLVIEAPDASGSLATAGFALEQNRDVFVVPGPITHPNFQGAHSLIRQGAELVTNAHDILAAYGIEKTHGALPAMSAASQEEKLIAAALTRASHALDVDKIIEMTKLEPRIVNRTITIMILKEMIRETKGQYTI